MGIVLFDRLEHSGDLDKLITRHGVAGEPLANILLVRLGRWRVPLQGTGRAVEEVRQVDLESFGGEDVGALDRLRKVSKDVVYRQT